MDYISEIRAFIINNFLFGQPAGLNDDTSFLDTAILDSTGMLELIAFLEEKYRIRIEPEEMVPENLDSVIRVAAFLMRKRVPVTAALSGADNPNVKFLRSSSPM